MTTRQARWADVDAGWMPFGDVTHRDAAELYAMHFDRDGVVETREAGAGTIFRHHVTRVVEFRVRSERGD